LPGHFLKTLCTGGKKLITRESEEKNEGLEQLPTLLSAWDVGRILGLSESTVQQLARDGELGYIELRPSKRKFTYELIQEFIESHTVRASKTQDNLDLSVSLEEWGLDPEHQDYVY
jgi:excisionase family DNA binding protein